MKALTSVVLFWLVGSHGVLALLSGIASFYNKCKFKDVLVYGAVSIISAVTLTFMYL